MKIFQHELRLKERKRGFHLVTSEIVHAVPQIKEIRTGVCHIFIQHTSASLAINENADPTVRKDLRLILTNSFRKMIPITNTMWKAPMTCRLI